MELPTKIREARHTGPHTMIIYSAQKAGKTTIVSQLKNSLLIECEPNGADYVDALVVDVSMPKEFNKVLSTIADKGNPYKYVIVDTITKLDEWSEIVGTYEYMNKPQGKNFNLINEMDYSKGRFTHKDPKFQTVHEIPNGYGYRYSRNVMLDWYNKLNEIADYVILLAHIKDKYIESKSGDTVEATDIALTGKVKFAYTTRVDAVAHFYRNGNQGILKFTSDSNSNIGIGGRCKHLVNEIVISDRDEKTGNIITYWDKVYPKE